MMGHQVLTRAMEQWWGDHGGQPTDPAWRALWADYGEFIKTKLTEITEEHVNEGEDGGKRFGMSKAGGCTRAAALKLLGHEGEPFSGSTRVTFAIGHILEGLALATLRALDIQVDGQQARAYIEPFMHSASDGLVVSAPKQYGLSSLPVVSVKTQGYKKSGKERSGKWTRRGFPELPFEGVRVAQPSWWAQAQAEMYGHGRSQTLVVVVAKDIVKAMEGDPYLMGESGNGSLTFYTEIIDRDDRFIESELLPVWQRAWDETRRGRAGAPYFLNGQSSQFVRLPNVADTDVGWGGLNQGATGSYNPCFGCDFAKACKAALVTEFRR